MQAPPAALRATRRTGVAREPAAFLQPAHSSMHLTAIRRTSFRSGFRLAPALALLCALFAVPRADAQAAAPASAAPAAQQAAPAPKPLSASKVSDAIDPALHWLRAQQDPKTGGYGGVDTTALVLRAFAESPRKYVTSDGPFMHRALAFLAASARPDGAIAPAGASPDEARRTTAIAAAALASLPEGEGEPLLARALEYLAQSGSGEGVPATLGRPEPSVPDAGVARTRAAALIAARQPDASTSGPRGALLATAYATLELNACWRALDQESAAAAPAKSARALPPFSAADRGKAQAAMTRGAAYLLSQAQNGRFGEGDAAGSGITAMAIGALASLPTPRSPEVQRAVDAGLDHLVAQHKSGAIRATGLSNYVSASLVQALVRAGRPQDVPVIAELRAFLASIQSDEDQGYSEGDRYYGGIGYGGDERPDLSNLSMALDALVAAGAEPSDPALRKALVFLQRCQNRSESNTLVIPEGGTSIASGNDGGAGYAPGESKAGFATLADGTKVPRSYGSMTYALLRCYLFAGLSREDERVQAAWRWIQAHYTLDVNPGFEASSDPAAPYQGLYYYFHAMARALAAYGEDELVDGSGTRHAWRSALCGRLVAMQRQDGSWTNENSSRWWEGNPVLATSYALLTLAEALPPQAAPPAAGQR